MDGTLFVIVLLCAVIVALVGWQLIVMKENRKLWSHFADIARGKDLARLMESHERQLRSERQERYSVERRLHGQIQAMAERLASLKLAAGNVEESESAVLFTVADHEHQPYSPDLQQFLKSIASQEARELVEEFIELRRQEGMHDDQILEKLRNGDYR